MLRMLLSAFVALAVSSPVLAQSFPSKTITVLVGVAPGGTLDTLARILAKSLTADLKQTVIVENVVGAGGLVALKRLTQSPADGHTLMFTNMSLVIIPHLHPTANVDPVKELDAVGMVATVPMVLSVSNKSGLKSLPELLARMRQEPGKINLGSGGPGTTAHLSEALFLHLSKTKGELVQYRGSGPALTDLMAGVLDVVLDQTVTMLPLHQDKKILSIAVSSPTRLPQMPEVPTFKEGGLPEFDLAIWNGVVAPKGLPAPVSARLVEAMSGLIDSQEFKDRLSQLAAQAPAQAQRGPAPLMKLIQQDSVMVAGLVKDVGLIPK
ncbi:MAG: tripartite tricarboxylate transporter substrate binding protein [Alcaligenaceae bacterium]